MNQKIAYFDCQHGVSGPLLLAALFDAGLPLLAVQQQLQMLPGVVAELHCELVQFRGLRGANCHIVIKEAGPAACTLADCVALLQVSRFAPQLVARARSVMQRLVAAEEAVRNTRHTQEPLDPVLALLEVVSVVSALSLADVGQVYASPLPLTGGVIQTTTGLRALPDPLTLEVLREVHAPWHPSPLQRELVTPVAAALLAELAQFTSPLMTNVHSGFALSVKQEQLSAHLSVQLGKQPGPERLEGGMEADRVTVIETHIDTMTGELLGALLDRLLEAGALDVGYTPLQMKKNRPGTRLTVICPEEVGEQLALLLLRETNTLGVRIQQVERRKAQRRQERIETPLGSMLVKIKSLGDQVVSVSPEYEECVRIARQQQIPLADVYEVARTAGQALIIRMKDKKENM